MIDGRTERRRPPANAEEALARARRHGRAALAESLETVRALIDAASFAATGVPAESHELLSSAYDLLESLARGLAPAGDAKLGAVLSEALDAEIARWEQRGREDSEARAVLRAFLGMRELLWEFGVRPPGATENAAPRESPSTAPSDLGRDRFAMRRPRVQRVPVQG